LFHLLGFQVDVLALSEAVDILSFDFNSRTLLALECTLGPLTTQGKLEKLRLRAATLQNALSGSVVVMPVIATAVDEVAPAELLQAGHNQVAVLSQHDLFELLELVPTRNGPAEVLKLIRAKVPPVPGRLPPFA
jgi:hypothetical protein